MDFVNNSLKTLKNMKTLEILLFILLILYLMSGVSTPYELAPYVNNIFMYASLLLIIYLLSIKSNIILTIVFAIAAFVFIMKSKQVDHSKMKLSDKNKSTKMKELNKHSFNKSLEEEIIGQIVKTPDNVPNTSNFHPVLCDSHNADSI